MFVSISRTFTLSERNLTFLFGVELADAFCTLELLLLLLPLLWLWLLPLLTALPLRCFPLVSSLGGSVVNVVIVVEGVAFPRNLRGDGQHVCCDPEVDVAEELEVVVRREPPGLKKFLRFY